MKAFLLTLAVSSYVVALGWNLTEVRAPVTITLPNSPVSRCVWEGGGYIEAFNDASEDTLAGFGEKK